MLLAATVPARAGECVLECGTGAGAALLCLLTGEPARQAGHRFGLTGSSVAYAKRLLPPNLKSQLRQLAAEVAAAEAAAAEAALWAAAAAACRR